MNNLIRHSTMVLLGCVTEAIPVVLLDASPNSVLPTFVTNALVLAYMTLPCVVLGASVVFVLLRKNRLLLTYGISSLATMFLIPLLFFGWIVSSHSLPATHA